ncbi:MAG: M12 family metallopeptidase [Kofleriaceae bacterium]
MRPNLQSCKHEITLGRRRRGGARKLAIGAAFLAACAMEAPPDEPTLDDVELAFPGEHGEVRTGLIDTPAGPRELTYELLHGYAVVDGDMLFPAPGGPRAAVRALGLYRWPGGVVPYTIDPALPTPARVTDAIAHWESQTKITFVPRVNETDYVTFRPVATGCSALAGHVGGQQFVNLASGCNTGNIIHEIGHTLGLWHEQKRADRDKHVLIHWANIDPTKTSNFETFAATNNDGRDVGAYDLSSIMHYGSYGFSINGQPTLTQLDGSLITTNRTAVTATDICAVQRLHGWGQKSDVNGDGYADVIVGVPSEDLPGVVDGGAVSVIFGGPGGLTTTDAFLHRDQPGIADVAAAGDRFGFAVTVGDFNGDCLADAAVGVPYDDVNGVVDAGSVQVFYGTLLGLANDEVWHLGSPGVAGTAAAGDLFGYTLTAGDFNGDGFEDLAVGIPYKDLGALTNAGSVAVLYGSAAGLTSAGSQLWHQNSAGIQGVSDADDHFGFALAAGDFNGDGFDELAVGVPNEAVNGIADAGVTQIIQGSIDGLTDAGNQLWSEANPGLPDTAEAGDHFGYTLAAGDFNADGRVDLAIGVPFEDVGGVVDAGSVTVMNGTSTGLLTGGALAWNQDTAGVLETAEVADTFGLALETGDFNADGYLDLAVGAPNEDVGALNSAGAVQLLYGSAAGIATAGNTVWTQNAAGIAEIAEAGDTFGSRLRSGDFNGDGVADLAIGVPNESVGAVANAGALHVLLGAAAGIAAAGSQLWTQDSVGILDVSELSDYFAYGL